MKISYFADGDMLYIDLFDHPSTTSEEVAPGIVLDYDDENRVVGIEFDGGSKLAELSKLVISGFTLTDVVMSQPETEKSVT